ncbi:hypothetical protein AGMMS49944_13490 [Spirochaetia bacterium]|nr:hypothetical protein AGMMS49944_13490 [Spirochaetia bacterium]
MDDSPLVSVIMNCYNGEEFLKEALDSVIAQDYTNWEIIFWDNCSSDGSAGIVKFYDDPRIHYYRGEKHVLLGEARNFAIEKTKGDYIAFLDVDDLWLPNKLSVQVKILNEYPEVGLVHSNHIYFSKETELVFNKKDKDEIVDAVSLIKHYDIGISSVLLKANIIRENKIKFNINYNLIEEFDYFIRLLCFTKAYYSRLVLMKLRKHENNTTKVSDQWHFEYNNFIGNVKKDEYGYPGLRDHLHKIKLKAATAEIFYWLNKHKSLQALKAVILSIYLSPKFFVYIIPVCIGIDTYSSFRDNIYKAFGKMYPK